eukprot:3321385-Amphidinium_carterae.1
MAKRQKTEQTATLAQVAAAKRPRDNLGVGGPSPGAKPELPMAVEHNKGHQVLQLVNQHLIGANEAGNAAGGDA